MDGTAGASRGTLVRSSTLYRPRVDHRCVTTVNPSDSSSTADSQSK